MLPISGDGLRARRLETMSTLRFGETDEHAMSDTVPCDHDDPSMHVDNQLGLESLGMQPVVEPTATTPKPLEQTHPAPVAAEAATPLEQTHLAPAAVEPATTAPKPQEQTHLAPAAVEPTTTAPTCPAPAAVEPTTTAPKPLKQPHPAPVAVGSITTAPTLPMEVESHAASPNEVDPKLWDVPLGVYLFEGHADERSKEAYLKDSSKMCNDTYNWLVRRIDMNDSDTIDPPIADKVKEIVNETIKWVGKDESILEEWNAGKRKVRSSADAMMDIQKSKLDAGSIDQSTYDGITQKVNQWCTDKLNDVESHYRVKWDEFEKAQKQIQDGVGQLIQECHEMYQLQHTPAQPYCEVDAGLMGELAELIDDRVQAWLDRGLCIGLAKHC